MKRFILNATKDEMSIYYKFMCSCEKDKDLQQIQYYIIGQPIIDKHFIKKYGEHYVLLARMIKILENHPQNINKMIFNNKCHLHRIRIEISKLQAKYDVAIKYNFIIQNQNNYSSSETTQTKSEFKISRQKSFIKKIYECFRRNKQIHP